MLAVLSRHVSYTVVPAPMLPSSSSQCSRLGLGMFFLSNVPCLLVCVLALVRHVLAGNHGGDPVVRIPPQYWMGSPSLWTPDLNIGMNPRIKVHTAQRSIASQSGS